MLLDIVKKLKLPLMLFAVLLLPLMFGSHIPYTIKSFSYALSLSMKVALKAVLPFIIFSFIFSCLIKLDEGAVFLVGLLILVVFLSNFVALMVGYAAANVGFELVSFKAVPLHLSSMLKPMWLVRPINLISNQTALILGFVLGIYFSLRPNQTAKRWGGYLNHWANFFLKRMFIPVLPLFIIGFVFKLEADKILTQSLLAYGPILLLIIITHWLYLLSWYLVASRFSLKRFFMYLRNVFPAIITGFSTISSAASLGVLLEGTEKNLGDKEKADIIVPSVINIHTTGSAIALPIIAIATMLTFGLSFPTLQTFLVFAFFTALAKFAVAAIPGGVIIVVAPLLEHYLGFSSEMVGLITAVYMILDPFGTAANVTSNGAFPILFDRLHLALAKVVPQSLLTKKSDSFGDEVAS